jgi:hypothetical protein
MFMERVARIQHTVTVLWIRLISHPVPMAVVQQVAAARITFGGSTSRFLIAWFTHKLFR